ncbi:MAG: aminotransferase class IV family protein [Phycisphaerales bacterium]|nr:aminotransferase class IV family protein [Phycisphaerales bacterium]
MSEATSPDGREINDTEPRRTVFLDGQFMDRADARVSAFDASVQHGVGLFETMSALTTEDGVVVEYMDDHLDRIQASAARLGLSDEIKTGPLGDAIVQTVREARYAHARVRLTITGGDLNMLASTGRSNHRPTVMIHAQPATQYPDEMFINGITATLAAARANPLDPTAGHKTLNYWWRLRELQDAAAKGAGEAIVFQVSNHLCGGCVSNLFVVKDGELITPIAQGEETPVEGKITLPSPVLPGITRLKLIGYAEEMGIKVTKRMMTIDDLLGADEVLLTNSSWRVLPVVRIEAEEVGDGKPGEVGKKLRERFV